MTIDIARARTFITEHGRVLDRRRFEALVDDGDSDAAGDAILAALDAYRNGDGGYGWGLEPDLRASESQPAAALHALEALTAVGPRTAPSIAGLLNWLERASLADGGLPFALPIATATGCAPFWTAADPRESSLQITAAVAAQAHRAARAHVDIGAHPWLAAATRYCFERIREIQKPPIAHVLSFSLQLLDAVAQEDAEARGLLHRLMRFVPADGALPVAGGAEGETIHLVSEPGMPLYEFLAPSAVAAEIDRLENAQQPDGGWPVDFDSYSPAAVLEWRGYTTVNAVRTLRTHGRL